MKKINMSEANSIVGGCCDTCVNSFEMTVVGSKSVCNSVKTCTDKCGVVTKTYTAANLAACGGGN